ncbi:MAG: hypothetical protein FWD43_05895, partial [Coriobacteriia bacterium]|nr:hypothetical protein [Coriobacteriia bacterium]
SPARPSYYRQDRFSGQPLVLTGEIWDNRRRGWRAQELAPGAWLRAEGLRPFLVGGCGFGWIAFSAGISNEVAFPQG